MARVHRFTLSAASRMLGGQRVTRGHTITLPVGAPGVAPLLADAAWDHTMISAAEPRGKAVAKAKADAAGMDIPRKSAAAFTGLSNRLTASVDELEAMTPAERQAFAFLVKGNAPHLVRFLTHLGLLELLAPTPETFPEAAPEAETDPEDVDHAPPATEPEALAPSPAPARPLVAPELAAEIQAAATAQAQAQADAKATAKAEAKAKAAEADRGAAMDALRAKLVDPGSSTMVQLVKLAKLAGLTVPEALIARKDRPALIAGLAELIASPVPASTVAPDPNDLG
jgi:hypothetical protein